MEEAALSLIIKANTILSCILKPGCLQTCWWAPSLHEPRVRRLTAGKRTFYNWHSRGAGMRSAASMQTFMLSWESTMTRRQCILAACQKTDRHFELHETGTLCVLIRDFLCTMSRHHTMRSVFPAPCAHVARTLASSPVVPSGDGCWLLKEKKG